MSLSPVMNMCLLLVEIGERELGQQKSSVPLATAPARVAQEARAFAVDAGVFGQRVGSLLAEARCAKQETTDGDGSVPRLGLVASSADWNGLSPERTLVCGLG